MENSIPIPQGKPGMEWTGMEWNGIWNIPWWNRPLVIIGVFRGVKYEPEPVNSQP